MYASRGHPTVYNGHLSHKNGNNYHRLLQTIQNSQSGSANYEQRVKKKENQIFFLKKGLHNHFEKCIICKLSLKTAKHLEN